MKNKITISAVLAILIIGFLFISQHFSNVSPKPTISSSPIPISVEQNVEKPTIGERTKTEHCVAQNALPDKDCTPGAIIDGATKEQICVPGYSQSVRNVPDKEKNEVYASYNVTSHPTGAYEVDHLISLELGGSNDISNIWPEPASPTPGFHEKDKVENYLHKQVCDGKISLQEAQVEIANNWLSVFSQLSPNQ